MVNKILKKTLHMGYPVSKSAKEIVTSSLFIGIATYLFLSIFEPFGTYTYKHPYKYLLLAPYSLIAFAIFSISNLVIKSTHWTLLKECIKIFITLLICSIFNYWYLINFINQTAFNIINMANMCSFTFAVGVPVCTMYILGRYIFLTSTEKAFTFEESKGSNLSGTYTLNIRPDSGSSLSINKKDFLYAESDGNYSTVFYFNNGKESKSLLRISLNKLQNQLDCAEIIRCHRSYIVNTKKITNIKGNALGYKLHLENICGTVPVSRKYVSLLQSLVPKLCRS